MRSFHDFNIFEYQVNCARREIILNLQEHHGEAKGVVVFRGVIGHRFESVLEGNIISAIEELSAIQFYESFEQEIQQYQQWGLPLRFKNRAEFEAETKQKNLKFIAISSSYGLSGWVICADVAVA